MPLQDESPIDGIDAEVEPATGRLRWVDRLGDAAGSDFAGSVRAGLSAHPKQLDCAWFYDEQGSQLFERICEQPEYYLTRAEAEILQAHASEIAAGCAPRTQLVELGSGNAAKTRLLIRALIAAQGRLVYAPIDIARSALEASARALVADFAALDVVAIAAEYEAGVAELPFAVAEPRLVLWLGSNAGNFSRSAAARFLAKLKRKLGREDRLLLGLDLRKDRATLERAYDDAAGVTALFNLNLLARIDRELGGHFSRARFQHRAHYDERLGRVDMYLESTKAQRVRIDSLGLEIPFAAGERIHTESSYKYSLAEIDALAAKGGWSLDQQWLDARARFCLSRLRPA